MARTALGPLCVLLLAALTVSASTPPNLSQTLEAQESLLSARPYDAQVYNDLGNLLVLDGRHGEAEIAYRRALELEPSNILARFNLGVLLQQTGRSKDAQAEFSNLLKINDRHGRAHYQLGALLETRGQRRKALDHYAKAFAFDPELTFAKNNPHLLDNKLATEAILLADRYDGDTSVNTPRLYGEPDRIVDLMLHEAPEIEERKVVEPAAEVGQQQPGKAVSRAVIQDEDDENEDEEADEDDEDEDENRRSLTNQDLVTGSSLGQASSGPSRRRPGIGIPNQSSRTRGRATTGGGATGSDDAGRSRVNTRQRNTIPTGQGASSGQRYRPGVASTGRLELKLLPLELSPEPTEQLADRRGDSATPSGV